MAGPSPGSFPEGPSPLPHGEASPTRGRGEEGKRGRGEEPTLHGRGWGRAGLGPDPRLFVASLCTRHTTPPSGSPAPRHRPGLEPRQPSTTHHPHRFGSRDRAWCPAEGWLRPRPPVLSWHGPGRQVRAGGCEQGRGGQVNAVEVEADGVRVLTGDARGGLKAWCVKPTHGPPHPRRVWRAQGLARQAHARPTAPASCLAGSRPGASSVRVWQDRQHRYAPGPIRAPGPRTLAPPRAPHTPPRQPPAGGSSGAARLA